MSRPTLAQAQARYPHRFTMDHVPDWARRRPCDHGGPSQRYYAPQFRSDAEWYENTVFHEEVAQAGLTFRDAISKPTWPLGQWLDHPFDKAKRA